MDALAGVKSETQLEILLARWLTLIPANVNPWGYMREQVANLALAKQPKSATIFLILASALAAIAVLLVALVWTIRWRKGSFWLVRLAHTRSGEPYILFHYALAWSACASCMLLAFQGYLWEVYQTQHRRPQPDFMLWVVFCWLPGVVAVIVACWTLTTTYILHIKTYASSNGFCTSSRFVAGVFLSLIIGHTTSIIPFAYYCNLYYRLMTTHWLDADSLLAYADLQYTSDPSSVSSATVVHDIAPHLSIVVQSVTSLVYWMRRAFIVFSVWALSLGLLFGTIGLAYIRALRKSLNEFENKSPTASDVFSRTLRNVSVLTAGFFGFVVIVSVNAVWVAALAKQVLTSGRVTELSILVPTLATVAGSLLLAVILLIQSLTAPSVYSSSQTRSFPSTQKNLYGNLSRHYTQFALAASERLPVFGTGSLAEDALPTELPFENLELQASAPHRMRTRSGTGSTAELAQMGGGAVEGITVNRKQEVTVVSLPRDEEKDGVIPEWRSEDYSPLEEKY
ncbi:hypothetical protein Rt10032_c12g4931 [Rhodotorula toruloides]|uniref:Uncharacterized protein n=1 Tax=Rhodotorula toruloides TaxID=5286 RepID=A0A511KN25_RHOTO|nr:hypothetical protein Rt10032_c12g4931 [Rhodotorula toruloides]